MTPATKLEELLSPAQVSQRDGKSLLSPNKTEEISAIARYANQHSLAIEITGAGTKRTWGNPVTADLLLDTTQLTGVLSHSWQDLTATVAAGTPWATMQRVLAQHNQQVALDPLWPETATVGGIIATNDSGALRLRYGSLRDLVIGMTIVLADGTIAKSGGKVVKNVAGYDLHKLMTGAFGTLGIITEVTFRLHPMPKHCQTFTVSAPQAAQLAGLMHSIHDSHLLAQALQLRGDSSGLHLDIQLSAHPDAKQHDNLAELVRAQGLSLTPQLSANIWQAREQLFASGDNSLILKITVPPAEITHIANDAVLSKGSIVAQSLGIAYVNLPSEINSPEAAFRLIEGMHVSADCSGGTLLLMHAPERIAPLLRARIDREFGTLTPGTDSLTKAIKRQFDPNRTLNPGRFLGGI